MAYVIKHQSNFFIIYDCATVQETQVFRCVLEPGSNNIYTNKSPPLPPSIPEPEPMIPPSCPLSSEEVKKYIEESEETPEITVAVAMPTENDEDDEIIKVEELPKKAKRGRKPRAKKEPEPSIYDDEVMDMDEMIEEEPIPEPIPEPEPEPEPEIIVDDNDNEDEILVSDNDDNEENIIEDDENEKYLKEKERRKEEREIYGELAPVYEDDEYYIDEDDEEEEEEEVQQNDEYDEYDDEVMSEEDDDEVELNTWEKAVKEYENEIDNIIEGKNK